MPEIPIDPKVWDGVVKMVEIMPKLELFEKIAKGETLNEAQAAQKAEALAAESDTAGNPFEERSKAIKAKLNGKTHIDREKN